MVTVSMELILIGDDQMTFLSKKKKNKIKKLIKLSSVRRQSIFKRFVIVYSILPKMSL